MKNKERYLELPSDFDEMTPADWQDAMALRKKYEGREVSAMKLRTLTAQDMLRRRGLKIRTGDIRHLHLVGLLARSLTWLWQELPEGLRLAWDSARQPMPQATIVTNDRQRVVLYGPADYGADLLFGEYRQAHAIVLTMNNEPARADELLCQLAGLLWRPADEQLYRQPYYEATPEECKQRGQRLRPWQRQTALLWLQAMTDALHKETFIIGGEEACFAPLFNSPTTGHGDNATAGLYTIGLTVAESGVFGTMEQVDRTPLLHVLLKLLRDKEKIDRMERKATTKP